MSDTTGEILGLHHVKVPVSDMVRSREFYERVLELVPLSEFADDHDGVVRGVVYRAKGDLMISLREQPVAAAGLVGYDPFAMMLRGRADIEHWADRLDALGVEHDPIVEASIGLMLRFQDPDGIEVRFYTIDAEGRDPEGRLR
jgi:catechol 2,3-dioxygenase-like lactoylglutathione lyase family enzyme